MSVPKHFVFDDEGKLTEVRGYKDEVVVERWGIVYDEEDKPVGLKPLPVKEVIPQSILDRIKFWRKPKPLTQILSIDFIGLIQYIGMIYKIKKVVTIEEIEKILEIINIKKVDVIGEITTIRDLTWSPKSLIQNPSFEQGFAGWFHQNVISDATQCVMWGHSCKFPKNMVGVVSQPFPVCLEVDMFSEFSCHIRASASDYGLNVVYLYSDGGFDFEQIKVTLPNNWERKVLSPTAGKYLRWLSFVNYYAGGGDFKTQDIWLDDIFVVF